MGDHLLEYLLKGIAANNAGPDGREILCNQMEQEYDNGNILQSVFYQVMMLFQTFDIRYAHETFAENDSKSVQELHAHMNEWEKKDIENNPLMQYAYRELLAAERASTQQKKPPVVEDGLRTTNFMYDVRTPTEGLRRIESVCKQMPKEWTVIQLCKGPRPDTTYTIYPKIRESNASIYLTVLRHARTAEYPAPICIRFLPSTDQKEESLFKKFVTIAEQFKQYITVEDDQQIHSGDFKTKYWQNLQNLEEYISKVFDEFRMFFYPWLFLFTGIPTEEERPALNVQRKIFDAVDRFCDTYKWKPVERVLLSLAALNVKALSATDLLAICWKLTDDDEEAMKASALLDEFQKSNFYLKSNRHDASTTPSKHYPIILIVDERLDHFYWEALNAKQEFCRVSSLHCLWRLKQFYKDRIRKGYLMMNVKEGGAVLNPDDNLAKSEMRMKSFFKYWLPHWKVRCRAKLTTENLCNEFFNQDCFVYAGHGSGLQYLNGKQLTRYKVNGVVFLFGCDSSRLRSNGLYSELTGAHCYYHAALCPAVVGTLLPGLDANMDAIAANILSRWLAPTSKDVVPWSEIEPRPWKKEGIIKAKSRSTPTIANRGDYFVGSLCGIISRVHQRLYDKYYHNSIGYICRGLPVWNCNAQPELRYEKNLVEACNSQLLSIKN